MYEQFFGLNNRPFTSTPYVEHYFPGESIHHALSQTRMCIDRGSGPVIVTGPSGVGKSTLLAMLANQYQNTFRPVNLMCGNMSQRMDLLQAILFELRLPYRDMSEGELRLGLIDCLKNAEFSDNGVLLLVDEAHNLSADLLDELRLITNFVRDGKPSVALVMAGSPALEDHLIDTKSESFNQRISARCYLTNLRQNETFEYITTHIERAGGNGDHMFTGDALKTVHQASGGCPRIVNQICDYALVIAASQKAERITAEIANQAWNDVQSIPGTTTAAPHTYSEPTPVYSAPPVNQVDHSYDSHPVVGNSNDEGLMVIEFGQLEDDETITDSASQIQTNETTNCSTACGTETCGSTESGLQIGFEPESRTEIDKYRLAPTLEQPQAEQTTDTSQTIDAGLTTGFQNPFSEQFDEEESIAASFIPAVSEQNLNALMLSTDHLQCLNDLECSTTPYSEAAQIVEQMVEEHDLAVDSIPHSNSSDELSNAIVTAMHGDDEIRMSEEGLTNLEQIASDIKQLQRDLQLNEQQFQAEAVHSQFQIATEQPLEELMQDMTISASPSELEQLMEDTGQLPQLMAGTENDQNAGPTETESARDDDQDIIISQPNRVEQYNNETYTEEGQESVSISTGSAVRMDYDDLFQQLRSPE